MASLSADDVKRALAGLADAAVQGFGRVSSDPHCVLLFVAFLDPKQVRLQ